MGDVLNILYIINKAFFKKANLVLNPKNSMHISKNDGRFEDSTSHQRDTVINMCTFMRLGRKYQTQDELERKKQLMEKRNRMIMNGEL
ncbi:MAG: hypothetical protein PHC62_00965 [Candidatus Izemoplasmatales bacterium]|nr:hypothetical protein [Candidatus Izemoplasmatales bacterium]